MKLQIKLFFYFFIFLFLFACSDKGRNDLTNPVVYLNNYGPSWMIYENFLNVSDFSSDMLYVNNNYSSVNFAYKEGDNTLIKLYWDGSIAEGKKYYGFYLKFQTDKDLTISKYNTIRFKIKGTLNNNFLVVKGLNDKDKIIITSEELSSTEYIDKKITLSCDLSSVQEIVGFAVNSANYVDICGDESILYIDDIELSKE